MGIYLYIATHANNSITFLFIIEKSMQNYRIYGIIYIGFDNSLHLQTFELNLSNNFFRLKYI